MTPARRIWVAFVLTCGVGLVWVLFKVAHGLFGLHI